MATSQNAGHDNAALHGNDDNSHAGSASHRGAVLPVTPVASAGRTQLGGYVEADKTIRLFAQVPGRVSYIAGAEGTSIKSGGVVVSLDQRSAMASLRGAWAELSGQMAASENAHVQLYDNFYGPQRSMFGAPYAAFDQMSTPFYNMFQGFMNGFSGGGSRGNQLLSSTSRSYADLSNARAQFEGQVATLAATQSKVDMVEAQLRDHLSIAPMDAQITEKFVNVGDIVQPGQPLATVANLSRLIVRLEVPVKLIGNIRLGEQVPISIGAHNLWAEVIHINPTASARQQTVAIKLGLPQGAPAAPGAYALTFIADAQSSARANASPSVPQSAILHRGSLPVAFVVTESGKVEMRVLRLGSAMGDVVSVMSGLRIGEQVVANPPTTLRSGEYFDIEN